MMFVISFMLSHMCPTPCNIPFWLILFIPELQWPFVEWSTFWMLPFLSSFWLQKICTMALVSRMTHHRFIRLWVLTLSKTTGMSHLMAGEMVETLQKENVPPKSMSSAIVIITLIIRTPYFALVTPDS